MQRIHPTRLPLLSDYYQRVLKKAQSPTLPLLADGIDVFTGQPACWQYPEGNSAPMSNFASQQNFLRGLIALSTITGDEDYHQQAKTLAQYFLDHYVDAESALFQWGGHRFINWQNGQIEGPANKERVHELKHHFPYYDFLHAIEPEKTERFIRGFWAAHILSWEKLDLSRHGEYGHSFTNNIFSLHTTIDVVEPSLWPQLPETVGLTFVNAATDLIYAACHLAKYAQDEDAARWAKHLYRQFVLARHPETGLPVYQFSSPLQRQPIPEDDSITFSWFGDRAKRQFGPEFGDIAREANVLFRDSWPVVVDNPLAMLDCAKVLRDKQLEQSIIDGITAYFSHAWDKTKNEIVPIWNDGFDMSGYELRRDGYYGNKGDKITRQPCDPAYLLTLVRASRQSEDKKLRQLTADMFARFELGELDPITLKVTSQASTCHHASAYLVIALIELAQWNNNINLLLLADEVAENLMTQHYHHHYFTPSEQHRFLRLDDPIPYALVALEAAFSHCYSDIPTFISTGGYLHGDQNINGKVKAVYDTDIVYGQLAS